MSAQTYAMHNPRPRHPPAPLRFDNASYRSSAVLASPTQDSSQTLLYDLPSWTPPTSPKSVVRAVSPTSPSYYQQHPRSAMSGRPTPPPSSRMRSTTPLGVPTTGELERFAEHCQGWYFHQDDKAGTLMTQVLAGLPPSQKASFSRIQSSIRSAYHRSVSLRRHAEFQAHLSATLPGASLMAHARADPRGPAAVKERHERFSKFLRTWCTQGMPGTKPFFEALWAVMRLQVIPENLGGAGKKRIEWEFDDAVFKEAAGKDFMLEAIDVLKGVLGFEEIPSSKFPLAYGQPKDGGILSPLHSRSQSQPLPSHTLHQGTPPSTTVQPKRARAPSDPFLDTPPPRGFPAPISPRAASPSPSASVGTYVSPFAGQGEDILASIANSNFDDNEEEYMRVWTSPDLSDPEILELLKLFPAFVTRRPLPRFPVSPLKVPDIEEGECDTLEGKQIKFGTGSMWVSSKERSDGWDGSWWTRFISWWKWLFSC